jgi:hypothetical protein
MEFYKQFTKVAEENGWSMISQYKINSFIVDSVESWFDKKNKEDYMVEKLKNGDVHVFKLEKVYTK